jgi:hypothetical protein
MLFVFLTCLLSLSEITPVSHAFTLIPSSSGRSAQASRILSQQNLSSSVDDDISRQLVKARALLEQAKAKVAQEKEQSKADTGGDKKSKGGQEKKTKRETVMKSMNADTGLITTDGELMAELSEGEDWEVRGLLDVFESEIKDDAVGRSLADRDVAASIQAMRISMQGEDYQRIFDKRNRFIGES